MPKDNLVLFCKTYHNDVHRARRLAKSVARFNRDNLPFYLCYPNEDESHFRELVAEFRLQAIHDADILKLTLPLGKKQQPTLPPNELQQVTKVEFWRLGLCRHFVLLDADSYFIRDFGAADFLYDEATPYTVMNEGRHVLEFAARTGNRKILHQYTELRERAKQLFDRPGKLYDFAPTPCVYSCAVWEALYEDYAKPRGMSFYDLIEFFPCETQWYGEFMLARRPIPLVSIESLFKCWHYREQYEESQRLGETEAVLTNNYLGIVRQSNWDHAHDRLTRKKRSWRTLWLKK